VKRAAVAPFQGYIVGAPTRAGDLVRRGQVLCVLDDRDLRIERSKWLSQEEQLQKQYNQAVATRSAAQSVILTTQIDQAKAEVALIDEKLARTRVVAPFDGIVVTGDLSQSLGAPVEQGQLLFEIAPLEAYRLVLQVDERDIADVMPHQRGRLVLAGLPEQPIGFEVVKITPVSATKEGHNYFRAEARLDRTPPTLRPGMEGVGKIEVERRLLLRIWTRQLVDWARLTAWKWTP
jgi:multidrug resistance efflux pump